MPHVLLIDNYDSFVFNLARYFEELGATTKVCRNDGLLLADVETKHPDAIVLSPGPGAPADAGICLELVRSLGNRIPILGVCLGHQVIAAALGGRVIRAVEPVHGRTSLVLHDGQGLFAGCESPLRVTRYHSLIVEEASLPETLQVTARTADGTIMALAHRELPVFGVQFHPESILTEGGHRILANFLDLAGCNVVSSQFSSEWVPRDEPNDFYRRPVDESVFRPA